MQPQLPEKSDLGIILQCRRNSRQVEAGEAIAHHLNVLICIFTYPDNFVPMSLDMLLDSCCFCLLPLADPLQHTFTTLPVLGGDISNSSLF